MWIAAPELHATVWTVRPDSPSKSGINTSSKPESCVEVVVARIRSSLAGLVGAGTGVSVGMIVDASIAGGCVGTGVAAGAQADSASATIKPRVNRASRNEDFILFLSILSSKNLMIRAGRQARPTSQECHQFYP